MLCCNPPKTGARQGIAFAEEAGVDASVLATPVYEKAAHYRTFRMSDASALEALRNYWRCALIGNICWQLAHTKKAQPVDLGTVPASDADGKKDKGDDKKKEEKPVAKVDDKNKPDVVATNPEKSC